MQYYSVFLRFTSAVQVRGIHSYGQEEKGFARGQKKTTWIGPDFSLLPRFPYIHIDPPTVAKIPLCQDFPRGKPMHIQRSIDSADLFVHLYERLDVDNKKEMCVGSCPAYSVVRIM